MFDKHFPITKMKYRYNNKLPWPTTALRFSIKTNNRLYIKYKIHKTAFNEMQYITYKNKLKYLMKMQEIKYYNELIHLNKNCMKKTWDTIKCVINKKKPSSGSSNFSIDGKLNNDKNLIADKFNEYFTNIGINLSKKIPNISDSFKQFMKGNFVQCMVLKEVNIDEIKTIILALKNGAPGPDNIPAGVIKHVLDVLAFPLTHICKLSLDQGYFPHELNCAKIIPLYKCKDAALFNN